MRKGVIEIGPQRYRESHGRDFEEFTVGDVHAAKTEFGKPLLVSTLTLAILVGMSVSDVSQKAVANLGWQEIRMTAPVFAGDTLYAETEAIQLRESASRPTQGLETVKTIRRNQHGVVICDFLRTMLVWKQGFGPGDE